MADHISLAVVSSESKSERCTLEQLSTSSAVCGRSHQPGSGLIRQQLSTSSDVYIGQTTSAWQWSHQRATEYFISCLWQPTSAWQWSHTLIREQIRALHIGANEHFISCLWQITSACQWSHQRATEHFISCLYIYCSQFSKDQPIIVTYKWHSDLLQ